MKQFTDLPGVLVGASRNARLADLMTAWIFQGNPKLFDMDAYLSRNTEVLWNARQGADNMSMGDTVYFWRSRGEGKAPPGIVASGVVIEEAQLRRDDESARAMWRGGAAREEEQMRVRIRLEAQAGERSLPEPLLLAIPGLERIPVFSQRNSTNYKLDADLAKGIHDAWANAPTSRELTARLADTFEGDLKKWRASEPAQAETAAWIASATVGRQHVSELVGQFVNDQLELGEFQKLFDRLTRNGDCSELGLKGASGAMVVNKWAKHFPHEEIAPLVQDLLSAPSSEQEARSKFDAISGYLQRRIERVESSARHAELNRIPTLASTVWQAEVGDEWPAAYKSPLDVLRERFLLPTIDDRREEYFRFRGVCAVVRERLRLSADELLKFLFWINNGSEPATSRQETVPSRSRKGAGRSNAASSAARSESEGPRTWLISPGPRGVYWEQWVDQGIAAIGTNELGDLNQYADMEAMREALKSCCRERETRAEQCSMQGIQAGESYQLRLGRG